MAMSQDEFQALAAAIDAIKYLCRGDAARAGEKQQAAERGIMRALGMVEIDGNWKLPLPPAEQETPETAPPR
jgi:hypothetical protein